MRTGKDHQITMELLAFVGIIFLTTIALVLPVIMRFLQSSLERMRL